MTEVPDRQITLEPLAAMPKGETWDLPSRELYVQLGCSGCVNMVRFTAKNITSTTRASGGTRDLLDLTREVEKREFVQQGVTETYLDPCREGCPDAEAIEIVTGMLNERFDANLEISNRTE